MFYAEYLRTWQQRPQSTNGSTFERRFLWRHERVLARKIPRYLCEVTRTGPKAVSTPLVGEAINCGWDAPWVVDPGGSDDPAPAHAAARGGITQPARTPFLKVFSGCRVFPAVL